MKRDFYVVIERGEGGIFAGEVPQLKACYSQGETVAELMEKYERGHCLVSGRAR